MKIKDEKTTIDNLIEDLDGYNDVEAEIIFTKAMNKRRRRR